MPSSEYPNLRLYAISPLPEHSIIQILAKVVQKLCCMDSTDMVAFCPRLVQMKVMRLTEYFLKTHWYSRFPTKVNKLPARRICVLDSELLFEQATAFSSQDTVCHLLRQRVGKCDLHIDRLVYHSWTKDLQRENILLSHSISLNVFLMLFSFHSHCKPLTLLGSPGQEGARN